MKRKKNRDKDLEKLRVPLTFLGLLLASSAVLAMLEWRQPVKIEKSYAYERPHPLTDEVIFTAIPERAKKPPMPQRRPVIDVIDIVDNTDQTDVPDLVVPDIDVPDVIPIEKPVENVVEKPVDRPDVYPEFPGGPDAMHAYLGDQIRYPSMARNANIQGTVWIEFLVDKNGNIVNAKIIRGIGGGCDREALRVVESMPRWKPGKQRGIPVVVRYRLPIKFKLRN